jgi:hypothetical protein
VLARLRARGRKLGWWLACRQVIAEFRELFFGDFPAHPGCAGIATKDQAKKHIVENSWYTSLQQRSSALSDDREVDRKLVDANAAIRTALNSKNNDWLRMFPGKELYRDLCGWIYTPPKGHPPPTKSIRESDLAKAVARWQVANRKIPDELVKLHQALRQRVGI